MTAEVASACHLNVLWLVIKQNDFDVDGLNVAMSLESSVMLLTQWNLYTSLCEYVLVVYSMTFPNS